MSGFTVLGLNSKTTFLVENKSAIYQEFTANAPVFKGQAVKLVPASGQVTPAAASDFQSLIIGYALQDTIATALVTVITRGVALIIALANAATQQAGPVAYIGYDTTHNTNTLDYAGDLGYSLYGAATVEAAGVVTTSLGWALDVSVAQYDIIRVLLKN